MNRMSEDGDKLSALFVEYRNALPDPEVTSGFMPGLWKRIEARRSGNLTVFRRLAQVCAVATLALTVIMGAVLIPRLEKAPIYTTTYADVLAANHPNTYVDIFTGDIK